MGVNLSHARRAAVLATFALGACGWAPGLPDAGEEGGLPETPSLEPGTGRTAFEPLASASMDP